MYKITKDIIKDESKETTILGEYEDPSIATKIMLRDFNAILNSHLGLKNIKYNCSTDYAYILDLDGVSYHYKINEAEKN